MAGYAVTLGTMGPRAVLSCHQGMDPDPLMLWNNRQALRTGPGTLCLHLHKFKGNSPQQQLEQNASEVQGI